MPISTLSPISTSHSITCPSSTVISLTSTSTQVQVLVLFL